MYFNLYLQYISGRLSAILPIFSYLKEYQLYLPVFYLKDYLLNVLHILVYADLEDYPLENLKATGVNCRYMYSTVSAEAHFTIGSLMFGQF